MLEREGETRKGTGLGLAICRRLADAMNGLMSLVDQALSADDVVVRLRAGPADAAAIAWIHEHGEVLDERVEPDTGVVWASARLTRPDAGRFRTRFPGLGFGDDLSAASTSIAGA